MPSVACPICEGRVFVESGTDLGEILRCDDCDENVELVGLDPLELDPATEDPDELEDGFNIFEEEE